jgi:hypothetical protein
LLSKRIEDGERGRQALLRLLRVAALLVDVGQLEVQKNDAGRRLRRLRVGLQQPLVNLQVPLLLKRTRVPSALGDCCGCARKFAAHVGGEFTRE